jgi:betaine lipid synthase
MGLAGGNILPLDGILSLTFVYIGTTAIIVFGICLSKLSSQHGSGSEEAGGNGPGLLKSFLLFFYSCFIKPHAADGKGTQQASLENFYKTQAGAYDKTRKVLLQGREDMLSLVAAQLEAKAFEKGRPRKPIWVDVGANSPRSTLPEVSRPAVTKVNTLSRLVEVQDGILRQCPNL